MSSDNLRARSEQLIRRAEIIESRASARFDAAPGAAVTGGSGRRRSGLHRKTAKAVDGSLRDLREAQDLRRRADDLMARAHRESPEGIAAAERREEAIAEADRREGARRRAAPILNRRVAPWHMDAATWSALHRDRKGLAVVEVAGETYRLRRAIRGGRLEEVFLTDRKEREG